MTPIQPAPVQLTRYTTDSIHFDVNPSYMDSEFDVGDNSDLSREEEFDFSPEVISIPSEEESGILRLTIGVNRDVEDFESYYKLSITVTGQFEWVDPNPSISEEEFRKYYIKSGLSLLYGIIRDRIVQLCSSSPYPRMMIPTITFDDVVEELYKEYKYEDEGE